MTEPYAYAYERPNGSRKLVFVREPHDKDVVTEIPLYTVRDLTEEEIVLIRRTTEGNLIEFVKAVLERAKNETT